jgi:hypothetical protein
MKSLWLCENPRSKEINPIIFTMVKTENGWNMITAEDDIGGIFLTRSKSSKYGAKLKKNQNDKYILKVLLLIKKFHLNYVFKNSNLPNFY